MPDRILRDLTDSDPYNSVEPHCRDLFIRLINKADDYGCFYADARRLRPLLYPLLLSNVRETDLERWIREIESAGLVRLYEADGRQYLWIAKWGRQRLRAKRRKYPVPPWESDGGAPNDGHVPVMRPTNDGHPPSEAETDAEAEAEAEAEDTLPIQKGRNRSWRRQAQSA